MLFRSGNLDLAVVDSGLIFRTSDTGGLSILLGKGDGTFQKAVNYSVSIDLWPNSISAGDFNEDGITDLIIFTPPQQNLWGDSGSGSRPKL